MYGKSRILTGIIIALVLTVVSGWKYLDYYAVTPADPGADKQVVMVRPGLGINALSRVLEERRIIDSHLNFRVFFYLKHRYDRIKAGEYSLSAAMPPAEIIRKLVKGEVVLHRLTIPEGYTVRQIAKLVDQTGLADGESFLWLTADSKFLSGLGISADTAEGYLFPETYFFSKPITAEDIAAALVGRFQSVFSAEWKTRAQALGFSVHQIVTLASIIEKETADPAERPLISSVFHNRLKRGMRLESDPTVIYGISDFNGNITRKHLDAPTAYNTYQISGLPPGPIASPGRASLEAALYPAESAFLFFVATGQGGHFFSTSYADHSRAVRKYQLHQ
ncbi:MAG: endolytic transglycosylase MltG [Thermodesulfobacteriota bacterium]